MNWSCTLALSVLLLCTCTSVFADTRGCEERQGCRIQQGLCLCGLGCVSDYIYSNKDECRIALKGRKSDICQLSPCLNSGSCSQTVAHPGFKCRCEGTGFYGSRCQYSCFKPGTNIGPNNPLHRMPYECIVI